MYRDKGIQHIAIGSDDLYATVDQLRKRKILIVGKKDVLLQNFRENQLRLIFFDFIQRKGDDGFNSEHFEALLEPIELAQIRRCVLQAPRAPKESYQHTERLPASALNTSMLFKPVSPGFNKPERSKATKNSSYQRFMEKRQQPIQPKLTPSESPPGKPAPREDQTPSPHALPPPPAGCPPPPTPPWSPGTRCCRSSNTSR